MKANIDPIIQQKHNAAQEAIKHVKDGFIVGLGSGSTAAIAIEALNKRVITEKMHIMGIPSSYQAFQLAVDVGIPITTLEEHPIIDVTIDGADQLTPELYLIKGGGAALTREKIIAASSKLNVIIADQNKKTNYLGANNQSVPIEVTPFALPLVKRKLTEIGAKLVVREAKGKLGPIITDNGNMIIDSFFGEIKNPYDLQITIKMIPGVVETGFFVGLTDIIYLGTDSSTEKLTLNNRLKQGSNGSVATSSSHII